MTLPDNGYGDPIDASGAGRPDRPGIPASPALRPGPRRRVLRRCRILPGLRRFLLLPSLARICWHVSESGYGHYPAATTRAWTHTGGPHSSSDHLGVNEWHAGLCRSLVQLTGLLRSHEVGAGRIGCCTYLLYSVRLSTTLASRRRRISPVPGLLRQSGANALYGQACRADRRVLSSSGYLCLPGSGGTQTECFSALKERN